MATGKDVKIAIFGLSPKTQSYAYRATEKLLGHGYRNLVGIHPSTEEVQGLPVVASIGDIKEPIHTLTMYIGPSKSEHLSADILKAKPQRIIFNPGAENPSLAEKAKEEGIEVIEACTMVMLSADKF